MNNSHRFSESQSGTDLARFIEPLANYICAAEKPKAALMSALAVLVREVEATNRAAAVHFQSYLQN
jgi:hypothetical protein